MGSTFTYFGPAVVLLLSLRFQATVEERSGLTGSAPALLTYSLKTRVISWGGGGRKWRALRRKQKVLTLPDEYLR